MDKDKPKRPTARRILTFDASQMSLSLLGKAFYNNPSKHEARDLRKSSLPPLSDISANMSVNYNSRGPITLMAANYDRSLAALISKENVELISVNGNVITPLKPMSPLKQRIVPNAATWQPAGNNNTLAIADQSGTIRIFDLNNNQELKLSLTSTSVGRSIRSLSFNHEQPQILAAAISDGSTRCFDLRQGMQRASHIFARNGDITRQVEFQPSSDTKFACIYDSGVVQKWDIRHRQPEVRINAHQQGLSLDWHPYHNYLVTGGRDHLLQVWNMGSAMDGACRPEYIVQVPNSVPLVKWSGAEFGESVAKTRVVTCGRPIESYSMRTTYSQWSLEEPFAPIYTVERHTDAVTDLCVASPNIIWSVGLDGRFVQCDLRYESTVRKGLPPSIVAMPPWDMAAVSFPCCQHSDQLPPYFSTRRASYMPQQMKAMTSPPPIPPIPARSGSLYRSFSAVGTPLTNLGANPFNGASANTNNTGPNSYATTPFVTTPSANGFSPGSGEYFNGLSQFGSSSEVLGSSPSTNSPGSPNTGGGFSGGVGGTLSASSSTSNVYAAAVAAANHAAANSNNPAAAANTTLTPTSELKYVLEIGLPYEDGESLRFAASEMTFMRKSNQTYADACRANAKALQHAGRLKYSEIWTTLAVAVEAAEGDFLRTLSGENKELASKWFSGQIDDNFEVRAGAIELPTLNTVKEETNLFEEDSSNDGGDEDDSDWNHGEGSTGRDSSAIGSTGAVNTTAIRSYSNSFSRMGSSLTKWPSRKRITGSTGTHHRGTGHSHERPTDLVVEKDPFQKLKEQFFARCEAQTHPWDFWPMLKRVVEVHLTNGYYTSAMAVLMLFRAFPCLNKYFDVANIIQGGLLALEKYGCFVPIALIRNILREESENSHIYGELVSSEPDVEMPDTICYRCMTSLSDNAAFYARNDGVVGYWYCLRCRLALDGCSFCDKPITGLCRVLIGCGHRIHMECWDQWVSNEDMTECPSGCGQPLTSEIQFDDVTEKLMAMQC